VTTNRWTDYAREVVAAVDARLPAGATLRERVAALRAAYPFGERKYYRYKAWLRVRRAYLGRHGYSGRPTPIEVFIQKAARAGDAPSWPPEGYNPEIGAQSL